MALFGKSLYTDKVIIDFGIEKKKENNVSLYEMAKEKFGEDKRLMLEIELFLSQKRKIHQNPSRIAWGKQLCILEQYPKEERIHQVIKSIQNDYRSLAYERKEKDTVPKVKMEKDDEEDIRFDLAF